ncbi:hypothetical protein DL764_005331 [Monosporascus ibericus]|uniref:Uncharacterized protein n=1 Tax=Monosporascus ibericus TaxID=155417 RepID=A0A4Q4TBD8_9PEZI|nr:hypothetical protein DL764_005331 [Monosporascus ibericus]
MAAVRTLGGTTIRPHTIGISIGNPLSVIPEPGSVNEAAFEATDWALYQAVRNAYNGLTYAEDPAMFAYETGNELESPASRNMDVPADWIRDIARLV